MASASLRRFISALLSFAIVGQWVTTESGDRVCRLRVSIERYMTLPVDFCEDWQHGFTRPLYGMTFPFSEGWIRHPPYSGIQLHVEDKWVP
jgi:hypothetical protein